MKRILAVLLAVMLLAAVVPAMSFAEGKVVSNAQYNVYHVTTRSDPLHLRNDHSLDGAIIARIPKGSALICLSSKTVKEDGIAWMKVKTTYGLTGWVATKDKGRKMVQEKAHADVVTREDPLNVRSGRGTKYKVLYKIPHGTDDVVVYKVNGNWAYVNYSGNSKKGWASLSYLRWSIW